MAEPRVPAMSRFVQRRRSFETITRNVGELHSRPGFRCPVPRVGRPHMLRDRRGRGPPRRRPRERLATPRPPAAEPRQRNFKDTRPFVDLDKPRLHESLSFQFEQFHSSDASLRSTQRVLPERLSQAGEGNAIFGPNPSWGMPAIAHSEGRCHLIAACSSDLSKPCFRYMDSSWRLPDQ